jgi:peptidoglycan/LPS O-acetylase OafA/YrhL
VFPIPQLTRPRTLAAIRVERGHLPLLVALRAVAALIILWHHYAFYGPLSEWAGPLIGDALDWLAQHARATQVFFAIGGYVLARSLEARHWGWSETGAFVAQRYCRLGLPYLAAIALVIPAYAFARGWLPESLLGTPVSLPQFLAHLFFLQDILGYEQLSAGLWFVCINFQLCLIYVALLWLRDNVGGGRIDFVGLCGWALALSSLFHFNLDAAAWDHWALYFFPYFFMGVIVHRALSGGARRGEFWLYIAAFVIAMAFEWRWRLASAVAVGSLLIIGEQYGLSARWPRNRLIARLGEISFSLFLVHFPVLVVIAAIWARLGWTSPAAAIAGLLAAFAASIAVAFIFYRWVEIPAARISIQDFGKLWRRIRIPWGRKARQPVLES